MPFRKREQRVLLRHAGRVPAVSGEALIDLLFELPPRFFRNLWDAFFPKKKADAAPAKEEKKADLNDLQNWYKW